MALIATLDSIDLAGKRVVLRLDLNVPVEAGKVRDATRIERAAPTIRDLIAKGASIVILSHFDRPKGKVVASMSLAPVATALAGVLGVPVRFVATDWRDGKAAEAAASLKPGDVALMENTRFHPGEEANDPAFSALLAGLGDIYVDDAFSCAHRAHASTEGIAHLLPAVAGRAMQAEIEALEKALKSPDRPLAAVIGGAKISTKLDLIGNILGLADTVIIGGAMANTFLAATGREVGNIAEGARPLCQCPADHAGRRRSRPHPGVAQSMWWWRRNSRPAPPIAAPASPMSGPDEMILDIGPKSIASIERAFAHARTLVWNGPFGAFEFSPFDAGTVETARAAARMTKEGRLVSVAGGGDTVAALNHAGVAADFTYVSTAGGAFLEWLEGKTLPGVAVLNA